MSYKYVGIDHVQLAAPAGCEEESRRFYGDLLGWQEIPKPESLKKRGGVWFQCGIHQVHIGVQKDFVPATKAHPAFQVQKIGELREYLLEQNVQLIDDSMRKDEGVERFYLTDPFGNRLEFLEWGEEAKVNSKERFSDRVESYVKYRPSYPQEAMDYLYEVIGLETNSEVADIGAGTGIFSKLLVERGSQVIAVEPNQAMREAAERELGGNSNFRAVSGSAEVTGLPDQSVDFIVSAQAFHWFDRVAAKAEFRRILKPGGKVVLIWNSRLTQGTPFLEEYEMLLQQFGTDYKQINHKNITTETLLSFFKEGSLREERFSNRQIFDYEGLSGRLMSSSYAPVYGHPNYEPMMEELRSLFDRNQQEGKVFFDYETEVYWGEV